MSDVCDDAQVFEEAERSASISRARVCDEVPRPVGDIECRRCGDEIEKERLAAQPGARRCLKCQEAFERLAKGKRAA